MFLYQLLILEMKSLMEVGIAYILRSKDLKSMALQLDWTKVARHQFFLFLTHNFQYLVEVYFF